MGRGRRKRRGFTLVELVVTMAIIGVLMGIAAYQVYVGRRRLTLERANLTVKGLLEQARSLSAIAGSRVGTNRLVYGAGCTNEAARTGDTTQWQLWVRFDGTLLEVPSRVAVNEADDTLVVACDTYDLAAATDGEGQYLFPLAAGDLAFTPSGRLMIRNFPGPFVYFQVANQQGADSFGVRVLPSGVVCESSVEPGPPFCNIAQ